MNAKYNGKIATLPLVVTQGKGLSLIERNWLAEMKLDGNRYES